MSEGFQTSAFLLILAYMRRKNLVIGSARFPVLSLSFYMDHHFSYTKEEQIGKKAIWQSWLNYFNMRGTD